MQPAADGRIRGLAFAKQFPNPAEPLRGLFVVEQLDATSCDVDWRVIAPVPWVPRALAGPMGKPYVRGDDTYRGFDVSRPRYPVLPKRRLYASVAPAVAAASRRAFARIGDEHRPAFLHAHALYPSAAAARRLAGPARMPLIVTIHGSDLYTNLARPAWERELREVAAEAAAIVCVSARLARDAVSLIGADPTRTLVIPDTYDEESFSFVHRERGSSPLELVTVGRLVPEKGHEVLLHALGSLVAEGRDVNLTVVGSGARRERIASLAEELGLARQVRLAGQLPPEALVEALAAAHAFVMPSLREGFGVALIEGMATGLPAIATRSGGPDDIVRPTEGVLVEPGDAAELADAIRHVADAPETFDGAAIAESIRRRYSKAAVGARLVRLYREVVAGEMPSGSLTEASEAVS